MLAGLGDLSKLQSLSLNVEQIEDASNLAKMGVTSLTSLSLNVNRLTSLTSLGKLKKLERLSLKDNKIKSMKGMKGLQSLVELLLDVNCLTNLDQVRGSCWFNLATLSVNTNKIKCLPSNLSASLPSLCMLNLYQNSIERVEVDTFRHLHSLTALDLGRNRLSDSASLGECLNAAPTLRRLVLSQNKMVEPPSLNLPLLQQLWLSGNKISGMGCWRRDESCFMPCLVELYLQENAIVAIGGVGSLR
jgi:Leucine-rich repeat (LRR) protein